MSLKLIKNEQSQHGDMQSIVPTQLQLLL